MYIRRKVFSVVKDTEKLYSVNRVILEQKEFGKDPSKDPKTKKSLKDILNQKNKENKKVAGDVNKSTKAAQKSAETAKNAIVKQETSLATVAKDSTKKSKGVFNKSKDFIKNNPKLAKGVGLAAGAAALGGGIYALSRKKKDNNAKEEN